MENDNIILICRHSERIDCTSERNNQRSKKGDPELTKSGIDLSKHLGQIFYIIIQILIIKYIKI